MRQRRDCRRAATPKTYASQAESTPIGDLAPSRAAGLHLSEGGLSRAPRETRDRRAADAKASSVRAKGGRDPPTLRNGLENPQAASPIASPCCVVRSAYRIEGADVVMEEFLRARWPAYSRAALEQVLPGGVEQALRDAPTAFEMDIGLTNWTFGEDEARRITQPALVVLGGDSRRCIRGSKRHTSCCWTGCRTHVVSSSRARRISSRWRARTHQQRSRRLSLNSLPPASSGPSSQSARHENCVGPNMAPSDVPDVYGPRRL